MNEKSTCYVVLGMHRSGTSLVAGILEKLGVFLGDQKDLLMQSVGNPYGYFEHQEVMAINDEILALFGGTWDNLPELQYGWQKDARLMVVRQRIEKFIHSIASESKGVWGMKDPRLSVTVPLWQEYLPTDTQYVVTYRNPIEIFQSLQKRNNTIAIHNFFSLWSETYASIQQYMYKKPHTYVSYNLLCASLHDEVQRLVDNDVSGYLSEHYKKNKESIDQLFDIRLHRNADVSGYTVSLYDMSDQGFSGIVLRDALFLHGWLVKDLEQEKNTYMKNIQSLENQCMHLEQQNKDIEAIQKNISTSKQDILEKMHVDQHSHNDGQQVVIARLEKIEKNYREKTFALVQLLEKKQQKELALQNLIQEKEKQIDVTVLEKDFLSQSVIEKDQHIALLQGHIQSVQHALQATQQLLQQKEDLLLHIQSNSLLVKMKNLHIRIQWALHYPLRFLKKWIWRGIPTYPQIIWALHNPKKFFKKHFSYTRNSSFSYRESDSVEYFTGKIKSVDKKLQETVDIIIPVFTTPDTFHHLEKLFTSLKENTRTPCRLIVIDDCSPDPRGLEYIKKISKNFTDFLLIENKENLGFIKSVNRGMKEVSHHFVILNTDVEVPNGWLERMIYPIVKNPLIATVTPFTNAGTICSFPVMNKDNNLLLDLTTDEIDQNFKLLNFNYRNDYFSIPTGVGFCMAFNFTIFQEIGFFDEVNFTKGYGEENDYCMRAINKGYQNVIAPNIFVYHNHGGTFQESEKSELMQHNLTVLAEKHPGYFSLVEEFITIDPLKSIREFLLLFVFLNHKKSQLIFTHALGGGAEMYLQDLINKEDKTPFVIVRFVPGTGLYTITLVYGETLQEYSFNTLDDFWKLASRSYLHSICVNNLVSYPDPLSVIDNILKYKKRHTHVIMEMHDFYCISEEYTLFYDNGECAPLNTWEMNFSGKKETYGIYAIAKNKKNKRWQKKWKRFLYACSDVRVYSRSSESIIQKVFPLLKDRMTFVPHKVDYIQRIPFVKRITETIHVAILGHIQTQKGFFVIKNLLDYIENNNVPMVIHLFGSVMEPIVSPCFIHHGFYTRDSLPILMERFSIHTILIPSIWSETFSYTTEEAISMQLPVVVFDIGAPAERVKDYQKGIVLSLESTCADIISSIQKNVDAFFPVEYKELHTSVRALGGRESWFLNEEHENIFLKTLNIPGWQETEDSFKLYEMGYYFGDVILEIGTYAGKSAVVEILGSLANKKRKTTQYFGIDIDENSVMQTNKHLEEFNLLEYAHVYKGTVVDFIQEHIIKPTMVFVDGDHLYEGVKKNLDILSEFLDIGTPVLCHDYTHIGNSDGSFGVKKAIDEVVADGTYAFLGVFGCSALLVFLKKK